MVLVDTPLWSLALRRKSIDLSAHERQLTGTLYGLISLHQAVLLGSTRQEVLSGIREESQFHRIREHLRDFPDNELSTVDYEEAARASNECRRNGIAGSPVDMLICAVALRQDWQIFTTDQDFLHYRRILKIKLFAAA
jgi:predicted nucleic acid-binding protein